MIDRLFWGVRRYVRATAPLIAVLLVMIVPSAALAAGSSTCNGYNPQTCSPVGATSVTTSSTTANKSSTLPFTGLDVVLLLAGAGVLTGTGLVLRRLSRRAD